MTGVARRPASAIQGERATYPDPCSEAYRRAAACWHYGHRLALHQARERRAGRVITTTGVLLGVIVVLGLSHDDVLIRWLDRVLPQF